MPHRASAHTCVGRRLEQGGVRVDHTPEVQTPSHPGPRVLVERRAAAVVVRIEAAVVNPRRAQIESALPGSTRSVATSVSAPEAGSIDSFGSGEYVECLLSKPLWRNGVWAEALVTGSASRFRIRSVRIEFTSLLSFRKRVSTGCRAYHNRHWPSRGLSTSESSPTTRLRSHFVRKDLQIVPCRRSYASENTASRRFGVLQASPLVTLSWR